MLHEVQELLKDPSKGLVKEARKGQLAMAERVVKTLESGGVTFVEAPVGTGKSLAYLVPASLAKGRTVISTAKKSLQDQLIDQDIPAASRATKSAYKFTVLKGASNYYCLARSNEVKSPAARFELSMWENDLEFTLSNGDVSTFPGGQPDYWNEVSVNDCDGKQCAHYATCGYQKALKDAAEAKLVVTNHHVVAHSFVRSSAVLGEYQTLVLDEAHQFEDALRSALSHQISKATFNLLDHKLTNAGMPKLEPTAKRHVSEMFDRLRNVTGEVPEGILLGEADYIAGRCAIIAKNADNALKVASDSFRRRTLMGLSGLATRLTRALTTFTEQDRSANIIAHVVQPDWRSTDREIVIEPIEVGAAARESMNRVRTVVVTSATLATAGSFKRIAMSCGLPAPGDPAPEPGAVVSGHATSTSLVVATPFDYQKQAVLYTPKHLPAPVSGKGPARDAWLDAVAQETKRLLDASNGNAFVLFTAGSDLTEVHRRLVDLGLRWPIVAQKQGAAAEAERAYRATPNAVLLGLRSFFEGVNIPGDKLWQVIIPKLPFPVPSDPVIKARTAKLVEWYVENGFEQRAAEVNAFKAVSVPAMLIDLRQAVGRLIRTSTDVGVCAILDPRVWTGTGSRLPRPEQAAYQGYGVTIVEEIGFPRRTSKFENIQAYYDSLRKR